MALTRCALLMFAVAVACGSDDADHGFRVVDQSDAPFFWSCTDDNCDVHRIAGVSPPLPPCDVVFPGAEEPQTASYSYGWNRFISIVGRCRGADGAAGGLVDWSRYVVCDADDDCPPLLGYDDVFECRAGFCQNVDRETYPPGPPRRIDLERLCMGDGPRYEREPDGSSTTPEIRAVLDIACPGNDPQAPCASIPDGCPDPG